jgi:hypothetical protein
MYVLFINLNKKYEEKIIIYLTDANTQGHSRCFSEECNRIGSIGVIPKYGIL